MAQERILIVDGDVSLSEKIRDRLEVKGYLVDCARSGTEALKLQNDVRSAVASWFASEGSRFSTNFDIGSDSEEESEFKTDFGINFDFDKTARGVFDFSQADQRRLEAALTTPEGRTSIHDMLFGSQSDGLLEQLHAVLSKAEAGLETEAGSTGLFVNAWI